MYLTSSHEPRYKRSTREPTARHVEERDLTENSTTEEDSTDRSTETEDTLASQYSESYRKESECSADCGFYDQRGPYTALSQSDNFRNTYIRNSRTLKHDKVTQKNLLSPFPSFTIPPIYREVSGPPVYRVSPTRFARERQHESKSPGRIPRQSYQSRKKDFHEDDDHTVCIIHNKIRDRKGSEKVRSRKEKQHHTRCERSEQILSCLQAEQGTESSGRPYKTKPEVGNYFKQPTVLVRKPKSVEEEEEMIKSHDKKGGRSRKKTAVAASTSEGRGKSPAVAIPEKVKKGKNVAAVGVGGGQVKEKLVYVVEERGKDVTKLETDLFTLNEILAIKKDLLELSEFAKKLKRLKEMKKETENGKKQQNSCHCKPAAELLKDVNKRIEALEARQEELERGSKCGQKEDTETESKNSNAKQTSSNSQSKMAVVPKPSAMTTVLSFPKMDMFVSREDDLSNNSDIVNELMDIKTQLQKLEKRRLTKETSEQSPPGEYSKSQKKDDHAIAVFSSRTYILTETFRGKEPTKKNEEQKSAKGEEKKTKNYDLPTEQKLLKEGSQDHVTNWLNGITAKSEEQDMSLYLVEAKREENHQAVEDPNLDLKCKTCSQPLKENEFEIQEPQKNRALNSRQHDVSPDDIQNEKAPGKQLLKYKECIVTPSGKIFAWVTKSNAKLLADQSKNPSRTHTPQTLLPTAVRQTESSGSIPSAVLTKEHIRKMKAARPKKLSLGTKIVKSESMQELSANSSVCKTMKTARNNTLKKFGKLPPPVPSKDKKRKEDKNHFLKLLEAHLLALTKTLGRGEPSTTSCTYSEFIASINLDTETTSQTFDSSVIQEGADEKATILAYTATTETDDIDEVDDLSCVDSKEERRRQKRLKKEEKKKRKKRESECRKKAKRRRKEQKKCDSLERKKKRKQKKHGDTKVKNKKGSQSSCCSKRSRCSHRKKSSCDCHQMKKSSTEVCPKRKTSTKCCSQAPAECNCKRKPSTVECTRPKTSDEGNPKKKQVTDCTMKQKPSDECHPRKKPVEECLPKRKSSEDCHYKKRHQDDYIAEENSSEEFHQKKKPVDDYYPMQDSSEEYQVKGKLRNECCRPKQNPSEECYVKKKPDYCIMKPLDDIPVRKKPLEERPQEVCPEELQIRRKIVEELEECRRKVEEPSHAQRYTDEYIIRTKPMEERKPTEEYVRRKQMEEMKPTEEYVRRKQMEERKPTEEYVRRKPMEERRPTEEYVRRKQMEERKPTDEYVRRKPMEERRPTEEYVRRKPMEERRPPEEYVRRKQMEERKPTEEYVRRKQMEERKPTEEYVRRKQVEERKPTEEYVRRKPMEERKPTEVCPRRKPDRKMYEEDIQISSSGNSSSPCEKSEESLEIKRKNFDQRVPTTRRDAPVIDTCRLKNFVKSLTRYYPKLNVNLPFRGDFCDKPKYKPPVKPKEESEDSPWEYCYYGYKIPDEDEADDDCMYWNRHYEPGANGHQHYHPHDAKVDHLNNCKCVNVYLQKHIQRGWSGIRPFNKVTTVTDSTTEVTSSRTARSTNKSEDFLPELKSQTFLAAHATEHRKKKKCNRPHKKHKKQKHKSADGQCMCKRCGNVHSKGHEDEVCCCENESQQKVPIKDSNERKADDAFPLFSFLTHFCKSKPRHKPSRFSLKKINEVRYLKTCPLNIKKSVKEKCRVTKKTNKKKCCDSNVCGCKPRLKDIEHRLSELESRKGTKKKKKKNRSDCESLDSEGGIKHRKKKRKKHDCCDCITDSRERKKKQKKPKRKKCPCGCRQRVYVNEGYPSDSGEKKKKKRKKKKPCICRPNPAECVQPSETAAFYHTICSQDDTQNFSTSITTTMDRKESSMETNSKDLPQNEGQKKEKLPSLHSFWKSLRKYKMSNGRQGMESILKKIKKRKQECSSEQDFSIMDEGSQSISIPRKKHEDVKDEPSSLDSPKMKLSKEDKKERKEMKRQSKRDSEKHPHKNQPERKRHK